MKTLYLLFQDGGDGSYLLHYTFSSSFVGHLKDEHDKGLTGHGDLGCYGGGFYWKELNLPDECTAESLGINLIDENDYFEED